MANEKLIILEKELHELQVGFTAKVKAIREKYFTETHQFIIQVKEDSDDLIFTLDYGALREPSEL